MPYVNNKGADQPAHLHRLISAFVVRCLDSIIPLVSISDISNLCLASVTVQAGLCLTWSQTPRTGFLVTRLNYISCCIRKAKPAEDVHGLSWLVWVIIGHRLLKDRFSHDYVHVVKFYCCQNKTNKWHVCPAKTQISMGIHPVWLESSLSAWRSIGSLCEPLVTQRRFWSDWAELCVQRRLGSAWASAQSDQSFCCPHGEALSP